MNKSLVKNTLFALCIMLTFHLSLRIGSRILSTLQASGSLAEFLIIYHSDIFKCFLVIGVYVFMCYLMYKNFYFSPELEEIKRNTKQAKQYQEYYLTENTVNKLKEAAFENKKKFSNLDCNGVSIWDIMRWATINKPEQIDVKKSELNNFYAREQHLIKSYILECNRQLASSQKLFLNINETVNFNGTDCPRLSVHFNKVLSSIFDIHRGVNKKCRTDIIKYLRAFYNNLFANYEDVYINFKKEEKGMSGENSVIDALKPFSGMRFIDNLVLKSADTLTKTTEIDIVLVNDKGIFVLEVKNYGGQNKTLKIDPSGKWVLYDKNRKAVTDLTSPVPQMARQILAIKSLLKDNLLEDKKIPIYSMVVLGNNSVDLENLSNSVIIRPSEITTEIFNKPDMLTNEEQERVFNLFSKNNLGEQSFRVNSYAKASAYNYCCFIQFAQLLHKNLKLVTPYYRKVSDLEPEEDFI
ncbi:nuclease-related domain-containing protein [Peptococcus simiae]|uniref:nuclease-related domain-containing protein n=1 Tax=Peptococcus simiae TaxID=1643805 RepID=UPI003980B5E3